MAIVFISHKQEDGSLARLVSAAVRQLGHEPYLDEEDPDTGIRSRNYRALTDHIDRQLTISQTMLLVFSRSTPESKWVPYEIGFIRGQSKPVAVLDWSGGAKLYEYLEAWPRIPMPGRDFGTVVNRLSIWSSWLKANSSELLKAQVLSEALHARRASAPATPTEMEDRLRGRLARGY